MNKLENTKMTWWLLIIAVVLHMGMIARALFIANDLRLVGLEMDRRQHALTDTLALTNRVREAEEAVRRCASSPSTASRKAYCDALSAADSAAVDALEAGAVSEAFTSSDISALRGELAQRMTCCGAGGSITASAAAAEFDRLYEIASALRRKLAAHSAIGLQENVALSARARADTVNMVVSSSLIATFILGLMAWIVYSMRKLNTAMAAQHEEILVLKNGMEQAPMAVVITDTAGKIEYVNPAFTEMYGYKYAEAVGQTPRVLKSGTMPQVTYSNLWRSLLAGRVWAGELQNKAKDGGFLWVKAYMSPVRGAAGTLTHFISLHKDVTLERRLMQEVVEAKQEADRANQAKSDFLASMSHEIRTPLNAIVGMSELIDESGLNKEQAQYLTIMRNASDTLLSLINDILDISKIESGKVELETAPFNLEELVSKVSEMIAVRAFRKNVEVNCSIAPDVPVMVEGDATRLRQVLMNLMGNAVKFVDKGWVSLEVKRKCEAGADCEILFAVRDNGIGIPADKLDAVFEKFTQADSSTTRKYGGTGLGLPISRMLVELMGGRIWVESEPGKGTVFYVAIKLKEQAENKAVYLPKADVAALKGKRFLVVDDNNVNRIIIRDIAHSWGSSCDGAEDAEAGLAALRAAQERGTPYHGIFVDFNMPGMDGREFCLKVQADSSINPKPAMALVTSDTVRFKRADFLEAGVKVFIAKPVKKQTVLDGALEMLAPGSCEALTPKTAAPKLQGISKEELPPLSLLIVDDSEDNRILMSSFLKGSKVTLQLAVDGEDALEKFKTGKYDLVFMDMQMPVMDGFTAAGKLREFEKAGNLPRTKVVALTAMATREDVAKALKAGCDDYLTKPIRKNTFYSYLVDFAAGRKSA